MSKIAQTPFTKSEIEGSDLTEQSNIADVLIWLTENVGAFEWKPRPKRKGSCLPEGGPCFDLHFADKLEAAAFKQRWIGEMRTRKRSM